MYLFRCKYNLKINAVALKIALFSSNHPFIDKSAIVVLSINSHLDYKELIFKLSQKTGFVNLGSTFVDVRKYLGIIRVPLQGK